MWGLRAFLNKNTVVEQASFFQQIRNTFILKRRWPPPLHKKNGRVPKLKARHFVYDLIEDTNINKKPDLKVILNQFVDGAGNVGDILTLRPNVAYKEFLLPGLAVYATPDNLQKYKAAENKSRESSDFSSPYVQRTINCLSQTVLQITMNKTTPWKLEPWHIKTSLRKAGYIVPEEAITMPPKEITGPDLTLQEKEFFITVKINNKEEVNVRCRIHHWATGLERLPWEEFHWKKPLEALIPEQAEILEKMPLPQ
ncbi:39S ribosomal protein L9, mitochondrial [Pieris rapae]|uniref:39S ribosomal protein L9, mitochondrial n=1 Tax=Pieris rapae TaxID=64459 RepID=UPI001E27F9A9|nr:39S ribosomal protein L9, mitochondrial [Pieris rapae]